MTPGRDEDTEVSMNIKHGICRSLFAVTVCASAFVAQAQTAQLKVRGSVKYVHGVNIGWFFSRYSTDIGINPLNPSWGNGYNSATANSWLNDIKNMKCNVARIWLFEGLEGLNFDSSGYVSGIQSGFLTNLDDLVAKANTHGLAYEMSLVNHTMDLEFGQTLPNGATVKNFVTDATARQRFLDNAVGPLVSRYNNNLAIFSYDVMNEIDLAINRGVCNQSQMRTFASAVATKIHGVNSTIQVTASSATYRHNSQSEHNSWYGGLGLDYYEYHNYATSPNLATKPSWLDKPLLLGEYGPTLPAPNYNGATWSASDQNNSSDAHINQAANRGYAGSLAWMYWNSSGNGENIVNTPGGNNDWETTAWTIQWWGNNFLNTVSPISVYLESFASDWGNWSWSSTVDAANTAVPYAGSRSIKVTSNAGWSAFSARKGTAISTSGYTKLRFYVYTPSVSRSFNVQTQTTDSGGTSSTVVVTSNAGAWKEIIVNLSSLGNPASIKRINIQNNSGSAIGDHWIDNIELIP
jgi:hypothetical protein